MNIRRLLTLVAVSALPLLVSAQKDDQQPLDPEHSNYVIRGDMSSGMNGDKPFFKLKNVTHRGITFTEQSEYRGDDSYDSETERVTFSFKRADTDHPNKFNNPLILWTWDKGAGKWKRDVEKTENKMTFQEKFIISVMMVLDCSGSMVENGSPNFDIMIKSALAFLDTLHQDARTRRNIRVGLIGFNTTKYADAHAYSPVPLTNENYEKLRNYIKNLDRPREDAGTAFYYSVDKAVDMLKENYSRMSIGDGQFIGSTIVAFTDGKDNMSKDYSKKITTLDDYLYYMQDQFPKHRVGQLPIWSRCIAFRGENVDLSEWNSMESDVKSVFGDKGFQTIRQMDELSGTFSEIARNLMGSFMVLNCQVPSAISGPVAWTIPEYGKVAPPPPPAPPKESHLPWIGVSAEFATLEGDYLGGLNVDMVFSITDMLGIGGRLGGLYNISSGGFDFLVGPEAKLTFYDENAIIAGFGAGMNLDEGTLMLSLRVGYKFKNPLFLTAETIYCDGWFGTGVGVGFSFGGN